MNELNQGLALLRAGDFGNATRSLQAALARDAGHLPTVRALATAHLSQHQPVAARKVLADYLANHPMCPRGWVLAARLEWKLARRDDAVRVLRRGLDFLPHSDPLKQQLARFLAAMGRQVESTPEAKESPPAPDYLDRVARDTRLLEGLINLPADDADSPMFRAIELRLARLVESQPMHADRQLLLARLQLKIGDLPAATSCVQRALRASPNFTAAHRLRATLLARAGDHEQAIRALQTLIAGGCHWPDLHVQIAQWQHATGKSDQARQHLYTALRINPQYQRARSLLERCAA
jgi:Tfp pilus assembly protein PilF